MITVYGPRWSEWTYTIMLNHLDLNHLHHLRAKLPWRLTKLKILRMYRIACRHKLLQSCKQQCNSLAHPCRKWRSRGKSKSAAFALAWMSHTLCATHWWKSLASHAKLFQRCWDCIYWLYCMGLMGLLGVQMEDTINMLNMMNLVMRYSYATLVKYIKYNNINNYNKCIK